MLTVLESGEKRAKRRRRRAPQQYQTAKVQKCQNTKVEKRKNTKVCKNTKVRKSGGGWWKQWWRRTWSVAQQWPAGTATTVPGRPPRGTELSGWTTESHSDRRWWNMRGSLTWGSYIGAGGGEGLCVWEFDKVTMNKLSSILSLLFLLHVATIKAGESHIEKSASRKMRKGNPKKLKPA